MVFRVIPRNLDFTLPLANIPVTKLNVLIPLAAAGVVYGLGLLGLCLVFRIEEAAVALSRFARRGKRS